MRQKFENILKDTLFIIFSIFAIDLCFANNNTVSQPSEINYSEQSLFDKLAKLKNMHASFNQTLLNPQQKLKQQSQGELWVSKPSFFKWQVLSPQKQMLLSNGKQLWNYDEELEQITINEVPKSISQAPYLLLLTGDSKTLNQLFTIERLNDKTYRLTPKVKDQSLIKYINMTFKGNIPTHMVIETETGQSTNIELLNISTQLIPQSVFEFTPPQGVDVLG